MLRYFIYTVLVATFVSILYNYDLFNFAIKIKNNNKNDHNKKLLTSEELKKYDGINKKQLYLALLGNVFDVTNGSKHYGPGQSYNIFIGRDASRNFVDGKFTNEGVSDDVINLSDSDLLSLNHWVKFYEKEYKKVGKLFGRHYDESGNLTPYGKEVRSLIKNAEKLKDNKETLKRKFPPCNVEYDTFRGSRVWCTRKSGGVERNWVGVPRQLYEPGSQSYRCACINEENQQSGNIKEYDNCASESASCFVGNI